MEKMRSLAELFRLDRRVAVITGGAGHIGLAIGEAFAEQGARVVVVDVDATACSSRAERLQAHGSPETLSLAVDLAAPESAARVVEETVSRFGRLDILVHNAALTGMSGVKGYAVPFFEQTLEGWQAGMDVNLTAAFVLAQQAAPELMKHGTGSIINVSSIYGLVAPNMGLYAGTTMGNPAAYAASKAGLGQLTRYLATVLAPKVRANVIAPGGIERGQNPLFKERYERLTPLGRMGIEEDIKAAAAYLASDASAYVTGQTIAVDGGWTTW